jgi:hypothetical protein
MGDIHVGVCTRSIGCDVIALGDFLSIFELDPQIIWTLVGVISMSGLFELLKMLSELLSLFRVVDCIVIPDNVLWFGLLLGVLGCDRGRGRRGGY